MKKCFLVLVCAFMLLGLTGCGSNKQVKCSKTETEDGVKMSLEIVADLDKDDKITKASMIYDFNDTENAKAYCDLFKMTEDSSNGASISCSGTKVTVDDIDKFEEAEDSEKVVGKTKDELVKELEEEGFTCK